MKTLIYVLGIFTLGYVGYTFLNKKDDRTIIEDPPINDYLQTQPQQVSPLIKVMDVRVDNADQPWYGGDRGFMGAVTDSFVNFSDDDARLLTYNTGALWTDLAEQYTH